MSTRTTSILKDPNVLPVLLPWQICCCPCRQGSWRYRFV